MEKFAIAGIALVLALAGCAVAPDVSGPAPEEQIVAFYEKDMRYPHCSVACVRGEKTTFAGDPRAIYRLGSLTKFFARAALERLHASGRLDLDASVTRYAPFALPEEYDSVTMRDLLENRSGLPREFLDPLNPLDWNTAFCCGLFGTHLYAGFEELPDFAAALGSCRSRRQVRARRPQYSNVGFALLSISTANAVGRTLDDILADEVARPLGLEDTAFAPSAGMSARLTPPCAGKLPWLVPRGREVPQHLLGPALRGTGSVISSAADCARFFASQWPYVDSLLAEKPLDTWDDDDMCGLLCVKVLPSGRRILYRFGMIYGGASYVAYEPQSHTIILILLNVTSWPAAEDFYFTDRLLAVGSQTP